MPPKKTYYKTKSHKPAARKPAVRTGEWLVIVESPSKCKKIEEYLGSRYQCIASKGHIRRIDGLKSIQTKRLFQPTFTPIDEKRLHIEEMGSLLRQFPPEKIILATDDDREGEAIAWHICEVFGLPVSTTQRVRFHEITREAVQRAIASPATIHMSLVYAQHSRQVLDILVGYTISPILWKYIYNDKTNGLSAGRCQTPALRIIYEHHVAHSAKPVEIKHTLHGVFFEKRVPFHLDRPFSDEAEMESFFQQSREFPHRLSIFPPKEHLSRPPQPFTTSRLLQTASSLYHFTPKQTMDLCQQLYQNGWITYMRTDSSKYSPVFLEQMETFLQNEWGSVKGDWTSITNQVPNHPHEAIRTTHLHMRTIVSDNRAMVSLYKLIWRNTVESCMSPAKYIRREIKLSSPLPGAFYVHTLDIPVFAGWKLVAGMGKAGAEGGAEGGVSEDETPIRGTTSPFAKKSLAEMANEQTGLLLYFETCVASGLPVKYHTIESHPSIESRHNYYSESTLIRLLESLGIGRPSTYATIVDTVQERGYVKKMDVKGVVVRVAEYTLAGKDALLRKEVEKEFGSEKQKLVIQPQGIMVWEFLEKYFESLFSFDMTKEMEIVLDTIATVSPETASQTWYEICRECYSQIQQLKKSLSKVSREKYALTEDTEVTFLSTGAFIKRTLPDGTVEYHPTKKGEIDMAKLKRGEYTVRDLLAIPEECLGVWNDHEVRLKMGRYGLYVEWGETKISLKSLSMPAHTIRFSDVLPFLSAKMGSSDETGSPEGPASATPSIRVLSPEMSVRTGKYGTYVFSQKPGVKKPTFLNVKKFPEDPWKCEPANLLKWLAETYPSSSSSVSRTAK